MVQRSAKSPAARKVRHSMSASAWATSRRNGPGPAPGLELKSGANLPLPSWLPGRSIERVNSLPGNATEVFHSIIHDDHLRGTVLENAVESRRITQRHGESARRAAIGPTGGDVRSSHFPGWRDDPIQQIGRVFHLISTV